jgi:hypothetical protein
MPQPTERSGNTPLAVLFRRRAWVLDLVPVFGYLGLAVFQYYLVGVGVFALAFLGAGIFFAARFYRKVTRREYAAPAVAAWWGGKRVTARDFLFLLFVAPLVTGPFALENVTVGGRPLLAGPVIRDIDVAKSVAIGHEVADSGRYFLVVDVVVGSRLGAPLDYLDHFDFELELDNRGRDLALRPTSEVPQACRSLEVPRWGSAGCRLVFQVPDSAVMARLRVEELQRAHTGPIELSQLPSANVPRVELSVRVAPGRSVSDRPDWERVRMFVRAEPVNGADPVSLRWLWLEGADGAWEAYDTGRGDSYEDCDEVVIVESGYCVAVFDVPVSAERARLVFRALKPLPDTEPSAGVIEMDL